MKIPDPEKKYPVSIGMISDITERVALKYPLLPRYEVEIIVKYFFKVFRRELLAGNTIQLHPFITNFRLISFRRNNYNVVQAKHSTARHFKRFK